VSLAHTLWLEAQPEAQRCLDHPFVQRIADGSLPREVYRTFIAQDAFFLDVFARGYGFCAEIAPDADTAAAFRRLLDGVHEELDLHRAAAATLDIDLDRVQPLPSTLAYTGFLEECIDDEASAGVTVASMAPCMRLYAYLGQALALRDCDAGPYRDWVAAYASDEMEELARTIETLLDHTVSEDERDVARDRYHRAMQLEYAFFDAAWRGEPEA
jgi:thiaminase/transcriptional activator TenA